MNPSILITCALGNTGSETARQLAAAGIKPVLADRDITRLTERLGHLGETRPLDFQDPSTYDRALEGIRTVFLVRPPQISDTRRFIRPFIRKCAVMGVEKIVFLSLSGVDKNPFVPHAAIEKFLNEESLVHVFLRPSFFMQNLSTTHARDIRERGEIFVPAGTGRTAFIDVRDICRVAVIALTENRLNNQAVEITGSEALTYNECAAIMSRVLKKTIIYKKPGPLAFYSRMRAHGHPTAFILVMIALYAVSSMGLAGNLTDTYRSITGLTPLTFEKFVEDSASCWSQA